jgi:hypothetical protein
MVTDNRTPPNTAAPADDAVTAVTAENTGEKGDNYEEISDEKDFFKNLSQETEQKKIQEPPPVEQKQEPPAEQAAAPPPKIKLTARQGAEIIVGSVDLSFSILFKSIHDRKVKRRFPDDEEREVLEAFTDSLSDKAIKWEEVPEELRLKVKKYQRLSAVKKRIPFSKDEKEQAITATQKVIELNGYDVPPWLGVTVAAINIIGVRIADAITE